MMYIHVKNISHGLYRTGDHYTYLAKETLSMSRHVRLSFTARYWNGRLVQQSLGTGSETKSMPERASCVAIRFPTITIIYVAITHWIPMIPAIGDLFQKNI